MMWKELLHRATYGLVPRSRGFGGRYLFPYYEITDMGQALGILGREAKVYARGFQVADVRTEPAEHSIVMTQITGLPYAPIACSRASLASVFHDRAPDRGHHLPDPSIDCDRLDSRGDLVSVCTEPVLDRQENRARARHAPVAGSAVGGVLGGRLR